MKINTFKRKELNKIARKYSGWFEPYVIRGFWEELASVGVEVGMLTNRTENDSGSWYCTKDFEINNEMVENSMLVFSCYEGNSGTKNEYNIYFS